MSRVALISLATLLTLTAGAAPARADASGRTASTHCAVAGFSPRSTTVGLQPVAVHFRVQAAGCTPRAWRLSVENQRVASSSAPDAPLNPASMHDAAAGAYNISIWLAGRTGGTDTRDFPGGFHIRRATSWTAASPSSSHVVQGAAVNLRGRLRRVDWDRHRFEAFPRATVQVQFRTSTRAAWHTRRTVRAWADGTVSATVRPTTTGSWRLIFLGNQTAAGSATPARAVGVSPAPAIVAHQASPRPVALDPRPAHRPRSSGDRATVS